MTHTIPHYIKSNAKNYPKDIALREKKFGVWKTKDWQQCLEEIENITLGPVSYTHLTLPTTPYV